MDSSQWASWENVDAENRPKDTGKRTEHGHRIIYNPAVRSECFEFPLGSGALYTRGAYLSRLADALRDAAPDMRDALRKIHECASELTTCHRCRDLAAAGLAKARGE
jgi:hypothetical protein